MNKYSDFPYAVLIGAVGSGKTTIAQKLSRKKNLGVKNFGTSATRQSTVYKSGTFMFADTPGYLSFEDKLSHAVNIIRALEEKPLFGIFLLIRFETRIEGMLHKVQEIFQPLRTCKALITIVITAWDLSEGTIEQETLITNSLKKNFKIESVLFTGNMTSPEELERMFRQKLVATPINIRIPPEATFRYFNLKKQDVDVIDYLKDRREEFSQVVTKTRSQADQISNLEEKIDFSLAAQIALKAMVEQMKDDLIQRFEVNTIDPEELAWVDQMHCELTTLLKTFRSFCKTLTNYSIGCDSDNPFRKCPSCGEVYIKVEGCDGSTTCGSVPTFCDGVKYIRKWSYELIQGKITFKSTNVENVETKQKNRRPNTGNFMDLITGMLGNHSKRKLGKGCGATIEWKLMAPVHPPREFFDAPIDTNDIPLVPPQELEKALGRIQDEKQKSEVLYSM